MRLGRLGAPRPRGTHRADRPQPSRPWGGGGGQYLTDLAIIDHLLLGSEHVAHLQHIEDCGPLQLPEPLLDMIAGLLRFTAKGHICHQGVSQFAIGVGDLFPKRRAPIVIFVFDRLHFRGLAGRQFQVAAYDLMDGLSQRERLRIAVERVLRAHPTPDAAGQKGDANGDDQIAPERVQIPPSSRTEGAIALSSESTINSLFNGRGMRPEPANCATAKPKSSAPQVTASWTCSVLPPKTSPRLSMRFRTAPSRRARSWSAGADLSRFSKASSRSVMGRCSKHRHFLLIYASKPVLTQAFPRHEGRGAVRRI